VPPMLPVRVTHVAGLFCYRSSRLLRFATRYLSTTHVSRLDRCEDGCCQPLLRRALRWDLASVRAVEDNPHSEVLGKILEPVLGACGHEDEVAGFERVPLAAVK
jgi:hypothetical protein